MGPLRAIALGCSLALAVVAQEQPPPELVPLVPPNAPWLRKNQAPADAQAPAKKLRVKKRKAPPAFEGKPSGESSAQRPLPLPLPPLAPLELPLPPAKDTNDVGVVVQNDGLDPAAAAQVADGLRGIAALAPHNRAVMLAPAGRSCADDGCRAELGAKQKLDQVLAASYRRGVLELRLVEVRSKTAVRVASQAAVPADARSATAWAEAMACRLMVAAGCNSPLVVDIGEGLQADLDGKPFAGKAEVPVGMHTLVARAGEKSAERALPVTREGTAPVYARIVGGEPRLLDWPPAPAPVAALALEPASSGPSRRWTKPVGHVALGLAVVAAAGGLYFGARSRSDLNDAESAYRSNGGAYRADQAALLSSGNSKARSANAMFAAAGVLAAAGAVFTFAF